MNSQDAEEYRRDQLFQSDVDRALAKHYSERSANEQRLIDEYNELLGRALHSRYDSED